MVDGALADSDHRAPCLEAVRLLASLADWYRYPSAVPLRILEDHIILRSRTIGSPFDHSYKIGEAACSTRNVYE
jgi:hypothetical protein